MNRGMKALGFIGVGLLLANVAYAAPSGLLNDTGQTQCLNVTGTALEECTAENSGDDSPYPGQDGRYGRDAAAKYPQQSGFTKPEGSGGDGGFAFTPLDVNGNPIPLVGDPPVPAESPRCVWDRVTNLIWEVKTDDRGLQDKNWTYNWGITATFPGDCYTSPNCYTKKYVSDLNETDLCGEKENNWSVPDIGTLMQISDRTPQSSIDSNRFYFPHTAPQYWSSRCINHQSNLGTVHSVAQDGRINTWGGYEQCWYAFGSSNALPVRLVRGGPNSAPDQSGFVDSEHGTIIDSGLMWDQCAWGQAGSSCADSPASLHTWQEALKVAKTANAIRWLGYDDWRIPNVNELISMPYLPSEYGSYYWSSTVYGSSPVTAWYI
ncbi:MAG: hypothetical protein RLZZ09_3669, partial [Pseudomonadota bacterium]